MTSIEFQKSLNEAGFGKILQKLKKMLFYAEDYHQQYLAKIQMDIAALKELE